MHGPQWTRDSAIQHTNANDAYELSLPQEQLCQLCSQGKVRYQWQHYNLFWRTVEQGRNGTMVDMLTPYYPFAYENTASFKVQTPYHGDEQVSLLQ